MSELVMDLRITWDSSRLKEIDEAKSTIMKYKRQGYDVILSNGTSMDHFLPSLEEVIIKAKKIGKKVMKILCSKGDERLTWDMENGTEALEAKKKFLELLKKNYTAYSVDINGKKHRKIEEFDVDAEEILMIPPTSKG